MQEEKATSDHVTLVKGSCITEQSDLFSTLGDVVTVDRPLCCSVRLYFCPLPHNESRLINTGGRRSSGVFQACFPPGDSEYFQLPAIMQDNPLP